MRMHKWRSILVFFCLSVCATKTVGENNEIARNRKIKGYEEVVIGSAEIRSLPSEQEYKNLYSYGFIFDVKAIRTLDITEVTFYTGKDTLTTVDYEIYTLDQSDFQDFLNGTDSWSLIAYGTERKQEDLSVSVSITNHVIIRQGKKLTFYITLKEKDLMFSSTDTNLIDQLGDELLSNSEAVIFVGASVPEYPLNHNIVIPRRWRGALKYNIMDVPTHPPSLSPSAYPSWISSKPSFSPTLPVPTSSPTKPPSQYPSFLPTVAPSDVVQQLSANITFTLFGDENLDFMDGTNDVDFSEQVLASLQEDLSSQYPPLELLSVNLDSENLVGMAYTELSTEISGKFYSSESFDFPTVIHTSIARIRSHLLTDLQRNTRNDYFQKIYRIDSVITPQQFSSYKVLNVDHKILLFGPSITTEMDTTALIQVEHIFYSLFSNEIIQANPTVLIVSTQVVKQELFSNTGTLTFPYLDINILVQAKFLPPPHLKLEKEIESSIQMKQESLISELRHTNISLFENLVNITTGTIPLFFDDRNFTHAGNITTVSGGGAPTTDETQVSSEDSEEEILPFYTKKWGIACLGAGAAFILCFFVGCCGYCCCRPYPQNTPTDHQTRASFVSARRSSTFSASNNSHVNGGPKLSDGSCYGGVTERRASVRSSGVAMLSDGSTYPMRNDRRSSGF